MTDGELAGTRLRNASRRLVVELAVVVLLAGVPVDFPRGTSSGHAWDFLVRHPSLLAHVVVAVVIVAEGIGLVVRALRLPGRTPTAWSGAGLVFTVVAVVSGVWFVSAGQHESSLTWMSIGWAGAVAAYAVLWWRTRRPGGAGLAGPAAGP